MKRHLLIACLCLLLGALVNVLVAWGCALWSPVGSLFYWDADPEADWPVTVPSTWNARPDAVSRSDALGSSAWTFQGGPPGMPAGNYLTVESLRAGWPFRSLQWSQSDYMAVAPWDQGVAVPHWLLFHRNAAMVGRLPLSPIWAGMMGNTVLYTVLFLLPSSCSDLVRHWRRRRGLCPACAYPVGSGDVCSECGRPRCGSGSPA